MKNILGIVPFLQRNLRDLLFEDSCTICHKKLRGSEEILCQACFQKWKEKSILRKQEDYYYLYPYEKEIRKLLHAYKFQSRKRIGTIFAKWMKEAFWQCYHLHEIDVVIPVPIHEQRKLERGFNQTEDILEQLQVQYRSIERIKNTKHLFTFHEKAEREKMMQKAFFCPQSFQGKNVLLFDDIITTGSTIEEMKRAIQEKGEAKNIYVFCLALAERVKK